MYVYPSVAVTGGKQRILLADIKIYALLLAVTKITGFPPVDQFLRFIAQNNRKEKLNMGVS